MKQSPQILQKTEFQKKFHRNWYYQNLEEIIFFNNAMIRVLKKLLNYQLDNWIKTRKYRLKQL